MGQLSNFVPMFTIAIKKRSVFVTQLGVALSFSDQIIFPSIDREHVEGGGIFSPHIQSLSTRKKPFAKMWMRASTGFWNALVTRIRLASFQQVDKSFYSYYGWSYLKN